jgi:hypothetical protein
MTLNNERTPRKTRRSKGKLNLTQAFKQAPWRNQIQFVGLFLLALVVIVLVASVYLSISGRAAAAGLHSYSYSLERQDLERAIADYKAQIAIMTSASVMEKRAKDAGFQRIDPSQAVYVLVPGYSGRQPVVLAAPPGVSDSGISLVKTIYRQSLWDWLFSGINRLSDSVGGTSQ